MTGGRWMLTGLAIAACGEASRAPTAADPPETPVAQLCTGYTDQARSPYVLPWTVGEAFVVLTGNCGQLATHQGIARYAYDFSLPVGTHVHAARAGTVIAVKEQFVDGNNVPGNENYIFIQHNGGTVARYYHLTRWGALVKLGQAVAQGELIGLSGNTGRSLSPSLHFDVVGQVCGTAFFGPRCLTIPLTFKNTGPHPTGLAENQLYRAEPY